VKHQGTKSALAKSEAQKGSHSSCSSPEYTAGCPPEKATCPGMTGCG